MPIAARKNSTELWVWVRVSFPLSLFSLCLIASTDYNLLLSVCQVQAQFGSWVLFPNTERESERERERAKLAGYLLNFVRERNKTSYGKRQPSQARVPSFLSLSFSSSSLLSLLLLLLLCFHLIPAGFQGPVSQSESREWLLLHRANCEAADISECIIY